MIRIIKNVIIRRFMELLILHIILSSFMISLNVLEVISEPNEMFLGMLFGVIVFVVIHIRMMRLCFFDLNNKLAHYISNYLAYLIFMAINLIMCRFCENEIYVWLFSITTFAAYIPDFMISSFDSALIFHGILILAIILAPLGMRRVLRQNKPGLKR